MENLTDTNTRPTVADDIVASYHIVVIDAMVVVQRIANDNNNQNKMKTRVEFCEKYITSWKRLVDGKRSS